MALGFGFNKTKILSSAEKFVQQGKLQNAIAEYEKVVKEDPKDLTVLNTIGDLYARVGQNERACEYFKKVGDQYAQNGFTVKAIAIYKKLTKLTPASAESIIKLAELYTQQGLFNDARTQYMQVADQLLKVGDNSQAARLFQKILELDPENTATQSKLADLYIKLGKKNEARNIYYSAAESLYARSSFDAADEALSRVLTLDPNNRGALLLRGMIAADSGDSPSAVQYLEQVPDLDSRPDALRALLRAKLQSGQVEGLEALASKLVTVHNDVSGISALADWFLSNRHVEDALKLYDRYAERFLSRGSNTLHETLYPLISRIRDNPPALIIMLRLLNKAGDSSHLTEVMELLAHAHVQQKEFALARDLYKELSEQEPENPLHSQNYRQMLSKLGEDPAMRTLTPEEGAQAFMVEELEHAAPIVHQTYDPLLEKSIEAALTDAELYVSYNVPLKAIAPLEDALPLAPRDVNLNQRLATLYLRAERFADAARVCKVLSEVYREAGHDAEAGRYAEIAQKYGEQAPAVPVAAPEQTPVAQTQIAAPPPEPPEPPAFAPTVQEFILDTPSEFGALASSAPEAALQESTVTAFGLEVDSEAPAPAEPITPALAHEIDLSSEWEDMLTVDPELIPQAAPSGLPVTQDLTTPALDPTVDAPMPVAAEPIATEPVAAVPDTSTVVADKIQEIQFYISQGFWEIAQAAIEDLKQLAPDTPQLGELLVAVSAGQAQAAAATAPPPVPTPEPEPPQLVSVAPVTAPIPTPPVVEVPPVVSIPTPAPAPAPREPASVTPAIEPAPPPPPPLAPVTVAPPVVPVPAPAPQPPVPVVQAVQPVAPVPVRPIEEEEFILDVPDELAPPAIDDAEILAIDEPKVVVEPVPTSPALPPPAPAAVASTAAVSQTPAVVPEKTTEDILGDFVLDLEDSLGDFVPEPESHQQVEAVTSGSGAPLSVAAHTNGEMLDAEATSVLSDILSELQEDAEESSQEAEDPETHYNLGIAFKEMGLLDEAIGELQKVCHAVDRGISFSQPIQAFTWLAQCLVDKGVPEAAVRWYERALKIPGLDLSSRCSIYYDLGSAYEASGDKKTALANFMEVYSSNIDFRDVANRIKTLKS
jgi:tetratricopeptide (TPR) repeat protein